MNDQMLLSAIKSAIAKRHRDNHDTSPPCAAEPDLELSDVKAALETLSASPSPSALTEGLEKIWHTVECEIGNAFKAENPHDHGYYMRRARIAFEKAKPLIASALTEEGVTEEMVERGANAGYTKRVGPYANHQPWESLTDYGREREMEHYRAAIAAALKEGAES